MGYTLRDLKKYLKTQRLMAVASYGEKIWAASVYFAIDDDLNFYFVSSSDSEHCKNLLKNQEVAVAITDSRQLNSGAKIGVQMRGIATQIIGVNALRLAIDVWNKTNPGVEKFVNLKNLQAKKISSRVYKIFPSKIKLFHSGVGGENEGEEIFEF